MATYKVNGKTVSRKEFNQNIGNQNKNKNNNSTNNSTNNNTSLSVKRPLEGGGTIIVTRSGQVTIRDEKGIVVDRYQADREQAKTFLENESATISNAQKNIVSSNSPNTPKTPSGNTPTQAQINKGVNAFREEKNRILQNSQTSEFQTNNDPYNNRNQLRLEPVKSTRFQRAKSFVKQKIIGNPVAAFGSSIRTMSDTSGLTNPVKEKGVSVNQFNRYTSSTATPIENVAAVGGLVTTIGSVRGYGVASSNVIKTFSTIKSLPVRFGVQIATGIAATKVGGFVSRKVAIQQLPSEQRKFIKDKDVYRTGVQAETQGVGFFSVEGFKRSINVGLSKKNVPKFEAAVREEYKKRGLTGERLETAVKAQVNIRRGVEPFGEAGGSLVAGVSGEITGRTEFLAKTGSKSSTIALNLARAGTVEGVGETASIRASPEQRKTTPLQTVGQYSVGAGVGALSASTLGFFPARAGLPVDDLATRGVIRGSGKVSTLFGNVADVFEPITDRLTGETSGFRPRVRTIFPSVSNPSVVVEQGGFFTSNTGRPKNLVATSNAVGVSPRNLKIGKVSLSNTPRKFNPVVSSVNSRGSSSDVFSDVIPKADVRPPVKPVSDVPSDVPVSSDTDTSVNTRSEVASRVNPFSRSNSRTSVFYARNPIFPPLVPSVGGFGSFSFGSKPRNKPFKGGYTPTLTSASLGIKTPKSKRKGGSKSYISGLTFRGIR